MRTTTSQRRPPREAETVSCPRAGARSKRRLARLGVLLTVLGVGMLAVVVVALNFTTYR